MKRLKEIKKLSLSEIGINFPPISKKVKGVGFGFGLTEHDSIRFHINPTSHGMSFGPVIAGYNIHVTSFEKNGEFNTHLTYSEKGWKKKKYEPITTMPHEEMVKFLINQAMESKSLFLEKYGETDEAFVLTDEGKEVFRELLKGSLIINVKDQKLLFDIRCYHLIDKVKILAEKANRLFRNGTVTEALENSLFGDGPILSPELKSIIIIGNEIYISKQSPIEVYEILSSLESSSNYIEDVFKELEKTYLRPVIKVFEMCGIPRLLTELERRNLVEKLILRHPLSI